jgi:hypothetical protein
LGRKWLLCIQQRNTAEKPLEQRRYCWNFGQEEVVNEQPRAK